MGLPLVVEQTLAYCGEKSTKSRTPSANAQPSTSAGNGKKIIRRKQEEQELDCGGDKKNEPQPSTSGEQRKQAAITTKMFNNGLKRPSNVAGKVVEQNRTELVCGEKSTKSRTPSGNAQPSTSGGNGKKIIRREQEEQELDCSGDKKNEP